VSDEGCCFYIICHERDKKLYGPVKIGMGENPRNRLRGLQTGNPNKLVLAHHFWVPTRTLARHFERSFHVVMERHAMIGEWFDMKPALALATLGMALDHFIEEKIQDATPDMMRAIRHGCGIEAAAEKLSIEEAFG
jgi:hypothetical protein